MINAVVVLQMVTFVVLAVLFARAKQWPLAIAQLSYAVATAALFFNKA